MLGYLLAVSLVSTGPRYVDFYKMGINYNHWEMLISEFRVSISSSMKPNNFYVIFYLEIRATCL